MRAISVPLALAVLWGFPSPLDAQAYTDVEDRVLIHCDFTGQTLTRLELRRTIMVGVRFEMCDLRGANFQESLIQFGSFKNADLRGASFRSSVLLMPDFRGAKLESTDLGGTVMRRPGRFRGATYDHNTTFPDGFDPRAMGLQLRDAYKQSGALDVKVIDNLKQIGRYQSDDFSQKDLRQSDFRGCIVSGATFRSADLRGSNMVHAVASSASFLHADLRFANLAGANLANSDLSHARLEAARLENACLEGAKFSTGTVYNSQTKFPDGFDPVHAGLTFANAYQHPMRVIPRASRFRHPSLKYFGTPDEAIEDVPWEPLFVPEEPEPRRRGRRVRRPPD